ncbi:hypothetical protein [Microbacterium galbinum]|uniref:Uncharacterized protein n=1 Tax=Microbacterium galbinum TaxID=2851646 RepID=A0ABY4ITS8_9MICO|nr:hypothetical protein [Microbacterium galbinum]UPL15417.1 hypothetical protein KV396_13425 [Microbacterium galbinum]
MQWRSRRSDPAELAVLHTGIPAWMLRPLILWATAVMGLRRTNHGTIDGGYSADPELLQEFETATRRSRSLLLNLRQSGVTGVQEAMGAEEFLDFVDFLLFHTERLGWQANEFKGALEDLLRDAGSEWAVGRRDGHVSLEKRVPEGVALAAEETIANSGDAGALLAEAWHAAFGRSPDPEEAYEKAIKAVEEAGTDKVSPKNNKATLGSMVRDMKAQKDWAIAFGPSHGNVAVQMAEALWVDQESRHGGNGYRKPTQAEAEAAVLLAVPLVQWFSSDALARRS